MDPSKTESHPASLRLSQGRNRREAGNILCPKSWSAWEQASLPLTRSYSEAPPML